LDVLVPIPPGCPVVSFGWRLEEVMWSILSNYQ
jgi:hypothetical protein